MNKYIYEMPPIDFWLGWSSINILKIYAHGKYPYADEVYFTDFKVRGYDAIDSYFSVDSFVESQNIKEAISLIREHTTWEGDGYIYVTAQPNDAYIDAFCFAIKQANNGTTFLCADYAISNLSAYLVKVQDNTPKKKLGKLPSLRDLQRDLNSIRNSDKPF
jgi:hypothetical protein